MKLKSGGTSQGQKYRPETPRFNLTACAKISKNFPKRDHLKIGVEQAPKRFFFFNITSAKSCSTVPARP